MKTPVDYLVASKVEDLASELSSHGYDVRRDVVMGDYRIDLVAASGGEKIAIEVVAGSRLQGAAQQISHLRREAREQGFEEFRLAVVNPPHSVAVEIAGLEEEQVRHLWEKWPEYGRELCILTTHLFVSQIEPDKVEVAPEEIRVAGTGVVMARFEYEGAHPGSMDFPLTFDVTMDRALHIREIRRLDVDTTSFRS